MWTHSETNSTFVYSTATERDALVAAERKFTDDKVRRIVEFKELMCPEGSGKNFVVINQKGIDPMSLDLLAHAGMNRIPMLSRHHGASPRQASEYGAAVAGMWWIASK